MRTTSPSTPAADDLHASRLILRDGTVAAIRTAGPADRDAVARFFHDLSAESRLKRFFTAGQPADELIDRFCDSSEPTRAVTLVASRSSGDSERIVAVASYFADGASSAEVAFAVADGFQGKGIGTLLLEQLAALARANGFRQFHATTLSDNSAMLDVFRESGFGIRSKLSRGCVDVELSLALSLEGVAASEQRRRRATVESLRPLMNPRAVAVVGASRDERKIGGRILRALKAGGFQGSLYAVHPAAVEIQGTRCVPSARELPVGVDLAIIAVPPDAVPAAIDDCAAAGVKSLVIITAGFAEVGPAGKVAQDALVEKVRGYGMRMVGPNCMGLLNVDPATRLNASFSPVVPPAGRVAFSSQSGALGIAILELAADRHVGLSGFVSVGNKADVSSNDLLEYWEDDASTGVILLYLESFGNSKRFARIARRIGRTKPIVAVKAGRTRAGGRAAGSHTAALASNDVAVSALFHQSGVIRAETIDEMFDIAACLDAQPLPRSARLAIVTNAGGPGILAADACEGSGLTMAELSSETSARLGAILPVTASLRNPVDMVAAAGRVEYRGAIEAVLNDPNVDAVVVIYTPVDTTTAPDTLEGIREGIDAARRAGARDKPVLACMMSGSLRSDRFQVGRETIPVYAFPENAVHALGKIAAYAAWRAQPPSLYWDFDDLRLDEARSLVRAIMTERGGGWLRFEETFRLLTAFGLPVTAATVAHSADEAAAMAAGHGYPVAAKIVSSAIQHKTDVGGVRLNLAASEAVKTAFIDLVIRAHEKAPSAAVDGVLIQPMVAGGVETIVGVVHDPVFGALVGFGIGGVDVEPLSDVRFRVAPLTDRDADELLHEIRGFALLDGHRGRIPADLGALRDVLLRVSRLAEEFPEILELDLNPVIALGPGQGCRIVDARIRLARAAESATQS